jgi:hypothetical protein
MWNKPIVVTQNQSIINGNHWSLMEPKEFTLLSVPVEINNSNKSQTNANELINQANVNKNLFEAKKKYFLLFFSNENKNKN